jgi:hypothetical protein
VQGTDKRTIQLQQWLATSTHDKALAPGIGWPCCRYGLRQLLGRGEPSPARSVEANEVRVTELANGLGPVLFPPTPQVTTGKTAEDRRAAGIRAFALKGVEDLFNGVAHTEKP